VTDQDALLQRRIFNWSQGLPGWQRGLMRKLCDGPLDEAGRAAVLAVLCDEAGAPELPPLELANLPADEAEHGTVELREIRNLENVNRLAGGQALRFGPGLNIVFGENGAGKSGYGRLCRRVCRAAEVGEVLHDVFDPGKAEAPQTAEFVLAVDGAERVLEVDLNAETPRILSSGLPAPPPPSTNSPPRPSPTSRSRAPAARPGARSDRRAGRAEALGQQGQALGPLRAAQRGAGAGREGAQHRRADRAGDGLLPRRAAGQQRAQRDRPRRPDLLARPAAPRAPRHPARRGSPGPAGGRPHPQPRLRRLPAGEERAAPPIQG